MPRTQRVLYEGGCVSLDPGRSYTLAAVFDGLRHPVREDHDYFVAHPPDVVPLDAAQLSGLEVRAPFFVDHGWSFGPDRDVVPFVWDSRSGGQPRFSEAEELTDYDSGLFGLASVSASTSQHQAQLYALLARAILDVHRANRGLLAEWFEGQGRSSRRAFAYFDDERGAALEKLLAADGTIDRSAWDERIEELAACLVEGAYYKHHFRWLEFLAHAVDIPQLVRLVQAAQLRI